MIPHYRRFWVLPIAALLALPMLAGLVTPAPTVSTEEARQLAPAPALPSRPAEWLTLPGQVDAYLRDHFGLRGLSIRTYAALMSQSMFREGDGRVLTGLNGWLFFRGDSMLTESAGLLRRDQRVAAAADIAAAMNHALALRGIRMVVASPPNSATIYGDQLPLWATNRGQQTEYDLFLDDLAQRGVPAVDLRPTASGQGPGKGLPHARHALDRPRGPGRLQRDRRVRWTSGLATRCSFGAGTARNDHRRRSGPDAWH
jgi:hypothetical protein